MFVIFMFLRTEERVKICELEVGVRDNGLTAKLNVQFEAH
jgi:hypothetical protein